MADPHAAFLLDRSLLVPSGFRQQGLEVEFLPFHGVFKIRHRGADADGWLAHALGSDAPAPCRETEIGTVRCAWLAPGEWLLTGPEADASQLAANCQACIGDEGAVTALTHGRALLLLSGTRARDVLSALCPLDVSNRALPVGSALRTLLGDISVLICRREDKEKAPVFLIAVDQSMARYVLRLLDKSQTAENR